MWTVLVSDLARAAIDDLRPSAAKSAWERLTAFSEQLNEVGEHPCKPRFPAVRLRGVDEFILHLRNSVVATYVVEPDCQHETGDVLVTAAKVTHVRLR